MNTEDTFMPAIVADASGKPLPVLRCRDEIWLESPRGPSRWPVLCLSIPKCGTNLLSELVVQLGWHQVRVHPITDRLGDWRYLTPDEIFRRENDWYRFPFSEASAWIHPGQLAATHVHPDEVLPYVERFKLLFVRRELREAVVSHMRHREKTRRLLGQPPVSGTPRQRLLQYAATETEFPQWAEAISRWTSQPDVFQLSFEEILDGDLALLLDRIGEFLEISIPPEMAPAIRAQLGRGETVTYSGQRSEPAEFWSDEVEEWFQRVGLARVNSLLGYDSPAPL